MYEIIRMPVNGVDQGSHCLCMPEEYRELTPEDRKRSDRWVAEYRFPVPPSPALRDAVLRDAGTLLRSFLTEEYAQKILALLYAYHTENDEVKAARHAVVVAEFERFLGTRWKSVIGHTADRMDYHMASMNIVSTPFLVDYAGAVSAAEFNRIQKLAPIGDADLDRKVQIHTELWGACIGSKLFPPLFGKLICLINEKRPLAESTLMLDRLIAIIEKIPEDSYAIFQAAADDFMQEFETSLPHYEIRLADGALQLLRLWLEDRLAPMDGLRIAAEVSGETIRRHEEGAELTRAAVAAGRNLGLISQAVIELEKSMPKINDERDAQMLAVLTKNDSQRVEAARERLRAKLNARKRGGAAPGSVETPSMSADTDPSPVYTWAIDKLMEWIDGSSPAKLKAALRKPPAQAVIQPKPKPGQKGGAKPMPKPKPATSSSVPAASTSAEKAAPSVDLASKKPEIQVVVRNGLRECARFMLGDVLEMAQRAQALGMAKDAKNLAACRDELQGILDAESFDPSKAAECFESAENTTRAVRQAARKVEAAKKFMAAFPSAVTRALRKEGLVFDKRTGGVIDPCGFNNDYWGAVSTEFHCRCLQVNDVRTPTGQAIQLRAGEALAFYVTGSSLSGYLFDISVHLWRRHRGSKAPPADGAGFMNEEHWYDTRIPYCVLHVGQAK